MRSKRYTCRRSCFRVALPLNVALFLQASSTLLHPYLQCMQSVALVGKVSPLATVRGLLITWAAWQYFTVWLAERLVTGLFRIAFPLPPIPLYIFMVVGGCYSLSCLQSSQLILFASCFFIPLFHWVFIIIIIIILLLLLFNFSLF